MPFKALIVDDEPMIRYGLSSCVNWEQMDIELAGEANNGETALELVREHQIDILITDIKMPRMDGLELIRQAISVRPHLKAILISSYTDFEYAQQAVRLGVVVDYLLKPTMETEDLVALLVRCKALLQQEASREQTSDLYALELARKKQTEFARQIKRMLNHQPASLDEKPESLQPPYSLSIWRMASADAGMHPAADRMGPIEQIGEKLAALCGYGVVCVTKEDELVLLVPYRNGLASPQIEAVHEQFRRLQHQFTVGISPPFHQLPRISDAYQWAEHALRQAFFSGQEGCYYGEIVGKDAFSADETERKKASEWAALRDRFSRMLASADRVACEETLASILAWWRTQSCTREQIVMQASGLCVMMASHPSHLQTEERMQALMNLLHQVGKSGTLDHLTDCLLKPFHALWELEPIRLAAEDPGSLHAVQIALTYIQENYRRNLSLQEVADHVHMSRNYFSEQFKRRTGLNFIDFIIRLRIYYARHLLETTSLKVYDVGCMAGFNSPKHFLKLFKREAQCTPAEYRHKFDRTPDS